MHHKLSNTVRFSMLFEELCNFKIYDDFYGEEAFSSDFSIVPTPETLVLLKKYKLGIKEEKGGIKIIQFKGRLEETGAKRKLTSLELMIQKGGQNKLGFFIILKNKNFLKFSNIKFCNKREVYYFSNRVRETTLLGLLLHPLKGLTDKQAIPLVSNKETITKNFSGKLSCSSSIKWVLYCKKWEKFSVFLFKQKQCRFIIWYSRILFF